MASSILRRENCGGSSPTHSNQISPFQMVCALFLPSPSARAVSILLRKGKATNPKCKSRLPLLHFQHKWVNPYFVSSYLSFIDLESKIKLQFRPGRLCAYLRACLPTCPLILRPSLVSHDITINVLTFTTPPLLRERGRTDHQPGQEKMGILAANNGPNPSRQRSEVTYFVWRKD